MKTLAQISCIAVTCLILLLMISSAQAQWYTEPLYAHVQPRLLDGRNVYFDDDAQTFSGLYDQPGLWFFTCDDDGCTTEPVDQRLYEFGRAYLFKRASVFEAVYDDETTGQIWHAGEAFDHWNVQPLDLPIPGKKLMSLTVRADTGLVYLIYKIGERKYLLAWEEWTNKDKVWRTEALDWYYGDTYPFAVTSDGAVHVISRDRSGGNVIRYWRRDPAGHWRREIVFNSIQGCLGVVASPNDRLAATCIGDGDGYYTQLRKTPEGWQRGVGPEIPWDAVRKENSFGFLPDGRFTFLYNHRYSVDLFYRYWQYEVRIFHGGWIPFMRSWDIQVSDYDIEAQMDPADGTHVLMYYNYCSYSACSEELQFARLGLTDTIITTSLLSPYTSGMTVTATPAAEGLVPTVAVQKNAFDRNAFAFYRKLAPGWRNTVDYRMNFETEFFATVESPEGIHLLINDYSEFRMITFAANGEVAGNERVYNDLLSHQVYLAQIDYHDGDLVLTWLEYTEGVLNLYFTRRPLSGSFAEPRMIAADVNGQRFAVGDDDLVRIAYRKDETLYLATEGDPFTTEVVDDGHQLNGAVILRLVDGQQHIFFDANSGVIHAWRAGGSWSFETVCSSTCSLRDAVVLADGTLYVAVMDESADELLLYVSSSDTWQQELLAAEPLNESAALWTDGQDVIVCCTPDYYVECLSSAPLVAPASASKLPIIRKKSAPRAYSSIF